MQPQNKTIIEAPLPKKIIYGVMLVLSFVVIIFSILDLITVTGEIRNIFSRVVWLTLGLTIFMRLLALFIHSNTRFTFEGTTLQVTVFRKKASSFDFANLQSIQPTRSKSSPTKRPTILLFTDTQGGSFDVDAYLLGALTKENRKQFLHALEPFILKEGAVQEIDASNVQMLLSSFDSNAPIRLTADADAFALAAKKRNKTIIIILVVGCLPLTFIAFLSVGGIISMNMMCDKLLANGKETAALITSFEPKTSSDTSKISTLRLDLNYSVNGQIYKKDFYLYNSEAEELLKKIKNGSVIQIRYLPEDPKTLKLASDFSDGTAKACKS